MSSATAGAGSTNSASTAAAAATATSSDSFASLPEQIVERQRLQKANYGVLQALGASASNLFHAPATTSSSSTSASASAVSAANSFLPPSSFHVPTTVTHLSSVSPASTASAAPTPILVALSNTLVNPTPLLSSLNSTTSPLQGAHLLLSPGVHAMLPPSSIPIHPVTNASSSSSSSSHAFTSPLLASAAAPSSTLIRTRSTSSSTSSNSHHHAPNNANHPAATASDTHPVDNASFVFERFARSGAALQVLKGTIAEKEQHVKQLETMLDEREAHVKRLLDVEHKLREQLMRHSQDKLNGDKLIAELQQKLRTDQQLFQENMKNVHKSKEIDIHQWQATTEKYKNELHTNKDELSNVKRELTALKLEKSLTPSPTASLENMHAVAAAFLPSQSDILALEARVKTAEESARTSKGELEMERKKFDKKLNKLLENRQQLVETNVEITNHCEQFEKALETLIQKNEIMEREKNGWQEQMLQKEKMIEKLSEQLNAKKGGKQRQKATEIDPRQELEEDMNGHDISEYDDGIEDTPIGRAVNGRGRPRKKIDDRVASAAAASSSPAAAAAAAAADDGTAAESATVITAATPARGRKRKNARNRGDDDEEEKKEPSDLEILLQAQKEKLLMQQQQNPQQAEVIPRRRGRPATTTAAAASVQISPRPPPEAFAAASAASNAAHAAIISPVATAIVSPALAAIASPLGPTPMSPQFVGSSASSRSLIAAAPINTPLMALTVKTRRGRPPKNLAAASTAGTRQMRPTISNLNTAPVPSPTLANVTAVNIMKASIASAAVATAKSPAKKRARTAAAVAASQPAVEPEQSAAEMELELFGEVAEAVALPSMAVVVVDPFAAIINSIATNWIDSFDLIDDQMTEQGVVVYSHPIDQLLPMLCKNIYPTDSAESAAALSSSSSLILCSHAIPRVFSSLFTQLVTQLIDRTGGSEMEPIFLSLKASNKVQLLVAQFIRACHWMISQVSRVHSSDSVSDEAHPTTCSCLPDMDMGEFPLLDLLSDLFYQSLIAHKYDHTLSISQAAIDCAHLTFLLLAAPDSVQSTKTKPSFIVGISVVSSVAHLLIQLLAGRLLSPLHLIQHFLCVLSTASNAAELKKLHPFHREASSAEAPPQACEHITSELSKIGVSPVWQRVFDASSPDSLLPVPQICSSCCQSRPILSNVCHTICRKLLQPYLSQSLQMRCPQLVHFVTTLASETEKPDQLLSSVLLQLQTYEKDVAGNENEAGSENRLSRLLTSWSLLMSSVGPHAALLLASEICIPLYEEARTDSNHVQARLWQQTIGIVADLCK